MNRFQQVITRLAGLDREIERRIDEEKRGWETVVVEAWRGNSSSSASNVTPSSSLQVSVVYACVRRLSEDIASLPLIGYERQERGRSQAKDYYLYEVLHDQPNPHMTALEFRETLQSHLLLWGNAYSQIIYDGSGRIQELWPLLPSGILQSEYRDGIRWYQYQSKDGKVTWLSEVDLWHLKGLSSDGEWGYSPITLMKRAVGLGMAAEEFGAKFFENDARPGVILEHPGKLGDAAHQHLVDDLKAEYQGSSKAQKPMVLEEGMKLHEVGIQPDHAQFLETRKFQVIEVCRMFLVPPHKIMDLDRATFSNIEQQEIDYWTGSVRPWTVRWEQSIQKNLMLKAERDRYYFEHKMDGVLRGDTRARYDAYAIGRTNGWLSANDIRTLENMDPIDGGDIYLVPLNMIPSDQVGGTPPPEPTPEPRSMWQETEERAVSAGRRYAMARQRLAGRQERLFSDIAGRILRRERNQIKEQARKLIPDGKVDEFKKFVMRFYEEHKYWSTKQMLPAMETYAELVGDTVEAELDKKDLVGQIGNFIRAYADEFGSKESARSQEYLLNVVDEASRSEERAFDEDARQSLLSQIEAKLDEWVDNRPASIAHEETIRENNAVAVALYTIGGVTKLMSVATGASSCPYCKNLDGKVIGIQEHFLTAGQVFNPLGALAPMLVTHSKKHSPYHAGCDCMTVSGGL